jgi:hypothetical protein
VFRSGPGRRAGRERPVVTDRRAGPGGPGRPARPARVWRGPVPDCSGCRGCLARRTAAGGHETVGRGGGSCGGGPGSARADGGRGCCAEAGKYAVQQRRAQPGCLAARLAPAAGRARGDGWKQVAAGGIVARRAPPTKSRAGGRCAGTASGWARRRCSVAGRARDTDLRPTGGLAASLAVLPRRLVVGAPGPGASRASEGRGAPGRQPGPTDGPRLAAEPARTVGQQADVVASWRLPRQRCFEASGGARPARQPGGRRPPLGRHLRGRPAGDRLAE